MTAFKHKSGLLEHQFVGDGYYNLHLRNGEVELLQEKIGLGPEAIYVQLLTKQWTSHQVIETIRLALIGGGLHYKQAHDLVHAYVTDGNLADYVLVAATVVAAYVWGVEPDEDDLKDVTAVDEDDPDKKKD